MDCLAALTLSLKKQDVSHDALFPDGREDSGGYVGSKGFVRVHPGHGTLDIGCIESDGERRRFGQREGRYVWFSSNIVDRRTKVL